MKKIPTLFRRDPDTHLIIPYVQPGCEWVTDGNPHALDKHILVLHGGQTLPDCPRDYEGLKEYLSDKDIEGVVWWSDDGTQQAKIKRRDYGLPWPIKEQ